LEPGAEPVVTSKKFLKDLVMNAEEPAHLTYLWLLFATGGRAACIFWVPFNHWIFTEKSVQVQWMLRKAGSKRGDRHAAEYSYEWSCPPPPAVKLFLSQKKNDWSFLGPVKNISGIINGWLKKCHEKLRADGDDDEAPAPTSSIFRDFMDDYLRNIIKVSPQQLKSLLDHSIKVSDAHYTKKPGSN